MKILKIILAVLFRVCLAKMPYGYYQFVRFGALVGFILLAINAYEKGLTNYMIVYIGIALLFQPFIKIALGRELWNIVDVIVAIGLLVSIKEPVKNK
jgi:hypothetical protein